MNAHEGIRAPEVDQVPRGLAPADEAAIAHLQQAVAEGRDWRIGLLEAIAIWRTPEEIRGGRLWRYVVAGEALDWLVLAGRLCETLDGLVPQEQITALLFNGMLPADITPAAFKALIGPVRHHQYLNYYYGIVVEEGLFCAVRDEVRKERHVSGFTREADPTDETYRRIYRSPGLPLLTCFRKEHRYPRLKSITLLEMKELAYWLFKYRLKHSDPARVASDTRKALHWLQRNGIRKYPCLASDGQEGELL